MNRYISLLPSVIRVLVLKLLYKGRIDIDIHQNIARGLSVKIGKYGSLKVGRGTFAREGFSIISHGKCSIGNGCFFNRNVSITSLCSIQIGDHVTIANNVVIVDHDHAYKCASQEYVMNPVEIGNRVWIGANSVILRGTKIGDGAIIAAGSIVKGTIPERSILVQKRQNQTLLFEQEK